MRTGVVKDKSKDKNVVHCRLKKAGKRFELSLVRDKTPSKEELKGRGGSDVNWDTVLAQRAVFVNAAKGELAKQSDLDAAFEGLSEAEIFFQILTKGEMLLTQEERAEQSHDASGHLRTVAERVAAMIFARPSAEEVQQLAAKKGGKHRLGRYSVDDVERELKNVKFKPSFPDLADQAVEGVVAVSCGVMLPTLREQSLLSVKPPEGTSLKDFGATLSAFRPGYCKVIEPAKGAVLVTIDPTIKAALDAALPGAEVTVVEPLHVPKGAADDLTSELPVRSDGNAPKPAAKKAPPKKDDKPKEKDAKRTAQEDSDDDRPHRKHHSVGNLEAQLAALKADDDDDDGKGKKGAKAGGKKAPAAKAASPPAATAKGPASKPAAKGKGKPQSESEESEEEEVSTMKPKKRR